ncbi:MAG: peptide chain release factor N(5)-glutamine methyltransferase [Sulfuricaulis sp.]
MTHAALQNEPATIDSWLQKIARELQLTSPTPRLDAEAITMHICGLDRSQLIARGLAPLTSDQSHQLAELSARRQRGEPIAYITGVREFWSVEFNVSPATLIPRPETELLVEKTLARIPSDAPWAIADLGTGCGAIALILAQERPQCRVWASDISSAALAVAGSNAGKLGLNNIEFLHGNWCEPLAGKKMNVIVSNPPYVRAADPHLEAGDVRFEPKHALVGGTDGIGAIRLLAQCAHEHLTSGGRLLFEHGWDQADAVGRLLQAAGYGDIVCHRDLAGRDRVTECRL